MSYSSRTIIISAIVLLLSALACGLPVVGGAPASAPTSGGPGAPASTGSGGCSNALYPVAVGVTWNYSLTGPLPDTFTRSITAVTDSGFTDQDVFGSGVTRTGQWNCNAGALIALDPNGGTTGTVQTEHQNANFTTTSMDGVTLPAAVNAGDTWSQHFTVEGTQNVNGQDVASKNVVAYSCTAGPTESVTVAAGTFNALHIDCQVDMNITVTMNGVEIPTPLNSTTTMWYAPGVGMVKSTTLINGSEPTGVELTSYTIP